MSELNTYSTEELQAEIESRNGFPKIIAVGELKTDMRSLANESLDFDDWFMSDKRFKGEIDKFVASIDVIQKGTRFVKLQFDANDSGSWFDDIGYGIEEMDDEWAKKNLENIKVSQ